MLSVKRLEALILFCEHSISPQERVISDLFGWVSLFSKGKGLGTGRSVGMGNFKFGLI